MIIYITFARDKRSSWLDPGGFGCRDGGKWKTLDNSLIIYMTERCEALCMREKEKGCCLLDEMHGSHWKPGAKSTHALSETATTSVTCFGAAMN